MYDYTSNGELHEACIIVEGGVTLTVHGGDSAAVSGCAIMIRNTSLEKGIYILSRIEMYGGTRRFVDEYGNYSVLDDDGYCSLDVYFTPV